MAVGLTVGILALFVAAAAWRLGATHRGLVLLVVAAGLGIGGRIAGVEEYVLLAVALGVLLAAGPIVLWHRAERAVGTIHIELRPSTHEVTVGSHARLDVRITNTGSRTSAPMRLDPPGSSWQLSRPGLRRQASESVVPEGAQTGIGGEHPFEEDGTGPSAGTRPGSRWRTGPGRASRVPALAAGASADLTFEVPTSVRGVLTMPSLRLWCVDPFELFAYEIVVPTETSIIVVPDTVSPRGTVNGVLQPAGRIEWAPPPSGEASGGQGFDLSGLRQYVPGDRLRLLHWPTLARTGELLVRDFEGSGTDAVTVIMDDRANAVASEDFERVVTATAGIGTEASRRGLGVELHTPGGVYVDMRAGPTLSKSLLRVLATLDRVPARAERAPITAFGAGPHPEMALGDASEKHRIIVTTTSAVTSLPDVLVRSATVVAV